MKSFYYLIEFCAFFLVSGSFMAAYFYFEEKYKRAVIMKRLIASSQMAAEYEKKQMNKDIKKILIAFGLVALPKNKTETARLKQLLGYAGYRSKNALIIFFGTKLALALLTAVLYLFLLSLTNNVTGRNMLFVFFPAAAGYYLPGLFLKHKVTWRHRQIFVELPDALDLLLICMEAGLSFDMALNRVSKELSFIAPVLSKEFGRYFLEIKGGLSRKQALLNLADRNGEMNLSSVVQTLIQSSDLGTDIAEAIKVYSDSLRMERRRIAEEKGATISTKLTFPTILLILPALMVIILGPALINLLERMK